MVTHTLAGAVSHSKLKCKQVWVIKKKNPMEKGCLTAEPRWQNNMSRNLTGKLKQLCWNMHVHQCPGREWVCPHSLHHRPQQIRSSSEAHITWLAVCSSKDDFFVWRLSFSF